MRYFSLSNGAFFRTIDDGIRGTEQTLVEMKRLIITGARDPVVINETRRVVGYIPEKDYKKEIDAIFGYVQNRVRYTKDVVGVETLTTPRRMIQQIQTQGFTYGDCDDKISLLGAMLESIGHPVRLIVTSQSPTREFQHVYLEVKLGERWISLDPTKRDVSSGWEQKDYTARARFTGNNGRLVLENGESSTGRLLTIGGIATGILIVLLVTKVIK